MHGICCHASVFLIRPTPTHSNTLQVILKISIFWFVDPMTGNNDQRVKAGDVVLFMLT